MTLSSRAKRRLGFGLGLVFAVAVCASPALAQTTTGGNLGSFLQNVVTLLSGTVAKTVAVLAIMAVGFAWALGRLDLRHAATVLLGIIVVFGAATIVDMITGGSSVG